MKMELKGSHTRYPKLVLGNDELSVEFDLGTRDEAVRDIIGLLRDLYQGLATDEGAWFAEVLEENGVELPKEAADGS